MSRKRKRLLTAGMVVAVSAVCCIVSFGQTEDEEQIIYKEETVAFGELTQGITESGSVEFLTTDQKYDLSLDLEEDEEDEEEESGYLRIEEVYVSAGERVEKGDAVFRLTDRSVQSVRRKLQAKRSEAQAACTDAENAYQTSVREAGQTYAGSVLAGETAGREYEIAAASSSQAVTEAWSQISVLQNEIEELEKELADEEAWEEYDDLRESYEEAKAYLEKCDPMRLATYAERREACTRAKEEYERVREERLDKRESIQEKQEEISDYYKKALRLQAKQGRQELEARQNYETAALEGELASEVYEEAIAGLREEMESAEKELEEVERQQEAFEAFVGDGVVCAEGSGLLTSVNCEAGDTLEEQGVLFSYVQSGDYVLSIDIAEEDIPYIEVGKEVEIVFTAYPDKKWQGTVKEIAAAASDAHAATVSYPVTVRILGDTSALYGGMTGDVTFVTDSVQGVVYVSRKAIVRENQKSYVYRKNTDGTMELVPVTVGFTDGISVEITEGLKEGDTVCIASKTVSGGVK